MNNQQIAAVFDDIAEMLKLKKDNIFKIRAYQKVAHEIKELSVEVEQLVREDRLKEIPGAGEAITKKITELVTTGKLEYYEKLKAEFWRLLRTASCFLLEILSGISSSPSISFIQS
ncbi:unnamed protein product, partial [marine sediment metagenome]